MLDKTDRALLAELQRDATATVDELAERIHLSRNACWRRVKQLEETGVIKGRVALLDAAKLGLGLTAFIAIRTAQHEEKWLENFSRAVRDFPEIVGVYRTTGETDIDGNCCSKITSGGICQCAPAGVACLAGSSVCCGGLNCVSGKCN
jgi:Lrp/AsnC family transcriptional regulator